MLGKTRNIRNRGSAMASYNRFSLFLGFTPITIERNMLSSSKVIEEPAIPSILVKLASTLTSYFPKSYKIMQKASDSFIKLAGLNLPKTMYISEQKTENSAKPSNHVVTLLRHQKKIRRVLVNHKSLMEKNDVTMKEKSQIFFQKSSLKLVNRHFEPLAAIEEVCK